VVNFAEKSENFDSTWWILQTSLKNGVAFGGWCRWD